MSSTVIDQNNLESFKEWLYQTPNPVKGYDYHLLNVDIKQILFDQDQKPVRLSEQQQIFLAQMATRDSDTQTIDMVIDVAETHPVFSGTFNNILGHGDVRSGYGYEYLHDRLKARPVADNLAMIDAILSRTGGMVHNVGTGEIVTLSAKDRKHLQHIFELSKTSSEAYEVLQRMTPALINYSQSTPELRQFINKQILLRGDVHESLNKLEGQYYTPELLSAVLKKRLVQATSGRKFSTDQAKTQTEKNRNILPPYYIKTRDALVKLAGASFDYWEQKRSLAERYKETCARLIGVNDWKMIPQDIKDTVIKDGLMVAAQQDIIDGKAELLDKNTIEMVLEKDKNSFYLKKIPEKVFKEKGIVLNKNQAYMAQLNNKQKVLAEIPIDILVQNRSLSREEKDELMQKASVNVSENQSELEQLRQNIESYKNDQKVLQKQGEQLQDAAIAVTYLNNLQLAYGKVMSCFKDNQPNAQEAYLSQEAVEQVILKSLARGEKPFLPKPEQKGLPLLMGREAEKNRRQNLNLAIDRLNEVLSQDNIRKIDAYKEHALSPEILQLAQSAQAQSQKEINDMKFQMERKYFDIDYKIGRERALSANVDQLEKVKKHLADHHNKLKTLSDKHLGKDQKAQLQAVHLTMTPEDKRIARAANRQVVDGLAQRSEARKSMTVEQKVQATAQEIKQAGYDRR